MTNSYEGIFENNKKWVEGKLADNPNYFHDLAKTQHPDYLYIGCSDSRATAEELMGVGPGEVFVHRNIANVVNTLDMSSTAVIQYAVEHLKVKHIIVCGHYNCGGVKAAMTSQDLGLLNPWLRNIRDVYRLHQEELDSVDADKKYDRLVELNVQEQCINVIKMACVQERYILDEYPIVHGWVFDLRTGKIIDLEIDFEKILKDIQKIYNLTDSDWVMSKKNNKNLI
ncbi:carbonic anhydrase [Epilithonimonas ginsengisoli]|uniref:Carbonic anhydrase n=2 Tax=Epilithonimonas TaxID=2782229 RepID=A0A085BM52_9FLAO|nr:MULTISPECIES: carbonic anhydrase [Chryseobacterium group]MBO6201014.1 carbonic anhydrase [Chryseobacterium sp.]WDF47313.1 carbonic anhydrase [Chryseobacterium sp. KACC 21268]KFC23547.1 carbonate dehydratase [Epilithonimonas lactis]MBV6881690.1 carbonic anhydrase [Epilithonimonas sp. FP105]MDW8550747.1 carbonic anhydrase [Epilithonimonas ginsengisoli]